MPSFRPAKEQARHAINKKRAFGTSRHAAKDQRIGVITSVGTSNKYEGNVKHFYSWLKTKQLDPKDVTVEIALQFLELKAEAVTQKTLDGYRQAIQMTHDFQIGYVTSKRPTILSQRAYRNDQVAYLLLNATTALSLSIQITDNTGLRAVELDTIARVDEMKEDERNWLPGRFIGRQDGIPYIVIGKGGLRRLIYLSSALAIELEKKRLPKPITKRQRGINYTKRYALIGGHSFSLQFSRLSKRLLGWSTGAHGLRHRYAQSRIRYLQINGYHWEEALKIVSQELGHFSVKNTLTYMR